MCKKLLILLCASTIAITANAEEAALGFMFMNNYNLRQNQDIWSRLKDGFKLNNQETTKVKYYEKLYTKSQATFNKLMKNAEPYLYFVIIQTERYGLPSELALIPIVESNYDDSLVNSTGRYDGIWQFVPSTGDSFSLYENNDINDRRNLVKATNAAMLYLNYLNLVFKQWDVAIGSYNWGPGNMYKAINISNQRLGNVDYNSLPLRDITANYVPKIIALANIIRNPNKFGIKLLSIPNQPYFAITHPINEITVAQINSISQTNNQIFKRLNPQFKNSNYTLNQQTAVLLPIKNVDVYLASIDINKEPPKTGAINNDAITKVVYSNINIADNTYNNTNDVDNTMQNTANVTYANTATTQTQQKSQSPIDVNKNPMPVNNNTILIIPKNAGDKTSTTIATANDKNDSEQAIDILVDKLEPNKISIRDNTNKVKIQATATSISYKVGKGDTLYSISKKFNVSMEEIKKTNGIEQDKVKLNQKLTIKNYAKLPNEAKSRQNVI